MPCHTKNRISNYRVILNGNLDYDETRSKLTSRPSARQHSPSPSRSNAQVRRRFKGGDLKALHLNWAQLDLAFQPKQDKENVVEHLKKSTEKDRMKNQKYQYHNTGNEYKERQQNKQRRQSARKPSAQHTIKASCYSDSSADTSNSDQLSDTSASSESSRKSRHSSKPEPKKKVCRPCPRPDSVLTQVGRGSSEEPSDADTPRPRWPGNT